MTDRTMPPVGPAMDALVADALGYSDRKIAAGVPPFSGYSAAAMRALEIWRGQHPSTAWQMDYSHVLDRYRCIIETSVGVITASAPTLEAAICQAIIRAQWALEDAG